MDDIVLPDGEMAIPLIGPRDPPAFGVVNVDGTAAMQLVCDHASNLVPAALADLGLDDGLLDRHIGYDIGAAQVTRLLAKSLDAQAILAGYSRLVIDLNRPPGHPESISEISDQIPIPGNRNLSEPEQNRRLTDLFEPYHGAITEALAHLWRRGMPPALFSVHSFTPIFGDEDRPWDVGVLWNRDPRIAKPLMDKLKAKGLNVGDNLPYSGQDLAYTINMHGGASGLANCVVEINQDQVRDQAGMERWAGILTDVMGDILVMKDIHEVREY